MSPVRLIILLVAAGAAIAAVFLIRSIQAPAPAVAASVEAPPPSTKQVLVARREIPVGRFVTVEDLLWQDWPEKTETPNFLEKENSPEALEDYVGAVAVARIVMGEPIVREKLVHAGEQGFMAAMLSPGMRAVSVEINVENAGGGFILPQDRVDVSVIRDPIGTEPMIGDRAVETLLQNVRVLAIDGIYSPPVQGQAAVLIGSRVTFELANPDANLLMAADATGDLKIALRSIADLQDRSGATAVGRSYRDGTNQNIRVFRYGAPRVSTVPAG